MLAGEAETVSWISAWRSVQWKEARRGSVIGNAAVLKTAALKRLAGSSPVPSASLEPKDDKQHLLSDHVHDTMVGACGGILKRSKRAVC